MWEPREGQAPTPDRVRAEAEYWRGRLDDVAGGFLLPVLGLTGALVGLVGVALTGSPTARGIVSLAAMLGSLMLGVYFNVVSAQGWDARKNLAELNAQWRRSAGPYAAPVWGVGGEEVRGARVLVPGAWPAFLLLTPVALTAFIIGARGVLKHLTRAPAHGSANVFTMPLWLAVALVVCYGAGGVVLYAAILFREVAGRRSLVKTRNPTSRRSGMRPDPTSKDRRSG